MIAIFRKFIKHSSEGHGIFSWLIWKGLFFQRIFKYFSVTIFQYYFHLKYKKDDIVKVVFIAPVHSSHFQSFLARFEATFPKDKHLCIMLINSDPSSLVGNSGWHHLLIDKPMYKFFGYSTSDNWNDHLLSFAENNLNPSIKTILRKIVNRFSPQLFWIHDMQGAGYLANELLDYTKDRRCEPTVCCSIWGNDLYFFHEHPLHRRNLTHLLKKVDFLHGECPRDSKIAKDIGFDGVILPVCSPTLGGKIFRDPDISISDNREIFLVVKSDYPARTNLFLLIEQIDNNPDFWKDKSIYFMPLSAGLAFAVEKLKFRHSLNITILDSCIKEEFQTLLSKSKFFLTCNFSDGSPMSVVAATNAGCVPVFSNHTGICDLFIEDQLFNLVFNFYDVNFEGVFKRLVGNEYIYLELLQKLLKESVINEERYDKLLFTINIALLANETE